MTFEFQDSESMVVKTNNLSNPKGNLTLGIYCINCGAQFEIGVEAIILAEMLSQSVLQYINYIQNSVCTICKKEEV